jgi:release factor glutamine methyltransferase
MTNNPDLGTIGEASRWATGALMGVSGMPRLDATLLLAHVLQTTREMILAYPERTLTDVQARTFAKLIQWRREGMPVAYLLGSRPFYDRVFRVSPHVLIPRPETELVVEEALKWAAGHDGRLRVIDVGTGSGVIGVTLAAQLPHAHVIATDVSHAALTIAQANAEGLPNITFVQADLLAPFVAPFDIIASNLPYIASAEMNILDVAKFEPHVALDGGADGLDLIRKLLAQAPMLLKRPGLMLLEHGADQGQAVTALAKAAFPDDSVTLLQDDAGLDRVVRIVRA